ncbi:hypothetical protein [Ornithinimicrobium sp. LYQ103]|uniref:hypothetical protein n=1 Tax=Ornithinimicrobium sp. LYQ103 TaxID=3378796 RepID=UPI0038539E6C
MRPVIDAGPCLNFLAAHAERVLLSAVGPLCAPETVRDEVLRKASGSSRFAPAAQLWHKLEPKWIEVLSDDATPELAAVVQRLSGLPVAERMRSGQDLGETMVIAHAVVAVESGLDVIVLIDDRAGALAATRESQRLQRLRTAGNRVGHLTIASTLTVLSKTAGTKHLPDKLAMRGLYDRMRDLDAGLVHIDQTPLLSPDVWRQKG